jgi:hypothetical protein
VERGECLVQREDTPADRLTREHDQKLTTDLRADAYLGRRRDRGIHESDGYLVARVHLDCGGDDQTGVQEDRFSGHRRRTALLGGDLR